MVCEYIGHHTTTPLSRWQLRFFFSSHFSKGTESIVRSASRSGLPVSVSHISPILNFCFSQTALSRKGMLVDFSRRWCTDSLLRLRFEMLPALFTGSTSSRSMTRVLRPVLFSVFRLGGSARYLSMRRRVLLSLHARFRRVRSAS